MFNVGTSDAQDLVLPNLLPTDSFPSCVKPILNIKMSKVKKQVGRYRGYLLIFKLFKQLHD